MNESQWYGAPHGEPTTAENGAIVSRALFAGLTAAAAVEPELIQVTDKVWVYAGGSIINRVFIEGTDAVIVFDPGDSLQDGELALRALRTVTDKPVGAVMYSHNHYAQGARAFADEGVQVIGHPLVNHYLDLPPGAEAAGDFPELGPVFRSRFVQQFGMLLPQDGPDAAWGSVIPAGMTPGALRVTNPAQDGAEQVVCGVRMRFCTRFVADSDDQLIVWLPDLGIVLNNFIWHSAPNFYPLRGERYRDPQSWLDAVRFIRSLGAEHLINSHSLPVSGAEQVDSTLERYADAIAFTIDQTLRGIVNGLDPVALRDVVELPEELTEEPRNGDGYGELSFVPPAIYGHAFGWFDGSPASIHPTSPRVRADRIVDGFGGPDAALDQARRAFEQNDLSWAAELAEHCRMVSDGRPARELLAGIYRALAHRSRGSIGRHFYLTAALELEGAITLPKAYHPSPGTVLRAAPQTYVEQFRIRLDPSRCRGVDVCVRLRLVDVGRAFDLHVRNGVCHVLSVPAAGPSDVHGPDAELALGFQEWAAYYCGRTSLDELLGDTDERGAPRDVVTAFFDMFDKPPASRPARPAQQTIGTSHA